MPQRNWLITGVSTGFGRIMTEQLLTRGDLIAGTVRNLSVMNDLKAEYGDRLWLAELDLSEIASIRGVVDRAWAALGRIDGVVSNAGYGLMDAAEELTDDQVRHRSTPIWSAQSNWSARRFHICAHRAAAGSYSFRAWGAKSPFPAARSITPPSGASRASSMRSHKKWRYSGSAAR